MLRSIALHPVHDSWGRMRLGCFCAPWREDVRQILPGMEALVDWGIGLGDKEL